MPAATNKVLRKAHEKVTQAKKLGENISFEMQKEKTFHKKWVTEQFGKVKNIMGKQIGGQMPGSGPDVLKFIKQYDPSNSSGAVKDGLDIMTKLRESTKSGDLLQNIQPIQNILGGMYGKFMSAAASATSAQKVQEEKTQEEDDIIAQLIAAAMAMLSPEDAILAADLLNNNEIKAIRKAYYGNGIYTSILMPKSFVDAINYLIPLFKVKEGQAVS